MNSNLSLGDIYDIVYAANDKDVEVYVSQWILNKHWKYTKAAIIYKSCVPNMNNFWYHLFELPEIQLSDAIS